MKNHELFCVPFWSYWREYDLQVRFFIDTQVALA